VLVKNTAGSGTNGARQLSNIQGTLFFSTYDHRLWNLVNINVPPRGADRALTIFEDTPYALAPADFGLSDASDLPANGFLAVKISSLPASGALTNRGAAVMAGQYVPLTDIAAGQLRFTPALDAVGTDQAQFTFQVQDNGGTASGGIDLDATPKTLAFNVVDVNDPPSGANRILTTQQNTAYVFFLSDFGFSDGRNVPANGLAAVMITTLPFVGALTNSGVAVMAGQFISAADILAGRLRFAPPANQTG